jgi:hypothetical protein
MGKYSYVHEIVSSGYVIFSGPGEGNVCAPLLVCDDCGSLVVDETQHDKFHGRKDGA